jgi:uncharacterized membrane protein YraQ (UPF0718 family)
MQPTASAAGRTVRKRRTTSTIFILGGICGVLALIALRVGGVDRLSAGATEGIHLLATVAPQLLLGFLMAGLATVLVPSETIARYVGEGSGLQGLAIATVAGAVTPGGPFLQFPLVAALLRAGASEGAVVAYLTAWSLLGMQRVLVWELPVMGPLFAGTRWIVSFLIPVLLGAAVPYVLRFARSQ